MLGTSNKFGFRLLPPSTIASRTDFIIIFEPSTELRDSENIPIKENIHGYFKSEVKPYLGESWIDISSTKIGYEISFNKYFYRHKPLPSAEEIGSEIIKLEQQNEGLISEILGLTSSK